MKWMKPLLHLLSLLLQLMKKSIWPLLHRLRQLGLYKDQLKGLMLIVWLVSCLRGGGVLNQRPLDPPLIRFNPLRTKSSNPPPPQGQGQGQGQVQDQGQGQGQGQAPPAGEQLNGSTLMTMSTRHSLPAPSPAILTDEQAPQLQTSTSLDTRSSRPEYPKGRGDSKVSPFPPLVNQTLPSSPSSSRPPPLPPPSTESSNTSLVTTLFQRVLVSFPSLSKPIDPPVAVERVTAPPSTSSAHASRLDRVLKGRGLKPARASLPGQGSEGGGSGADVEGEASVRQLVQVGGFSNRIAPLPAPLSLDASQQKEEEEDSVNGKASTGGWTSDLGSSRSPPQSSVQGATTSARPVENNKFISAGRTFKSNQADLTIVEELDDEDIVETFDRYFNKDKKK